MSDSFFEALKKSSPLTPLENVVADWAATKSPREIAEIRVGTPEKKPEPKS